MPKKRYASNGSSNGNGELSITNNNSVTKQEALANRFYEMVSNEYSSREALIKRYMDPRRSINDECGYPTTADISVELYDEMYDREAVAARVVDIESEECWQITPKVMEDDNPENETEFEKAFNLLGSELRGSTHYKQSEGSLIWEMLERVDKLSGIGHFGVVLLGLDDGQDLDKPALMKDDKKKVTKEQKLLFMRVFNESLVQISQYEQDMKSPRYGQPTLYDITLNDPDEYSGERLGVGGTQTVSVHWSRIIHIADSLKSSEIFAIPRQRPVWNRLLDLQKIYGAGAEGYWKGAFPGLTFTTAPSGTGQVKINHTEVKEAAERYFNTHQRSLIGEGMEINSLAPQVVDFTTQVDTILTNICIRLGIPKRIFLGSERGELASGTDQDTWKERIQKRRERYLTPRVVVPFVDRLILLNILPEPGEDGYRIEWSEADNTSPQDKATLAQTRVTAMASYIGGGLDVLMSPMDFLVREMGYDEDDAQEILEETLAHMQEAMPDEEITTVGRNPPPPELGMEGGDDDGKGGPPKDKVPTKGNGQSFDNKTKGGNKKSKKAVAKEAGLMGKKQAQARDKKKLAKNQHVENHPTGHDESSHGNWAKAQKASGLTGERVQFANGKTGTIKRTIPRYLKGEVPNVIVQLDGLSGGKGEQQAEVADLRKSDTPDPVQPKWKEKLPKPEIKKGLGKSETSKRVKSVMASAGMSRNIIKKAILPATLHIRENQGSTLEQIAEAIGDNPKRLGKVLKQVPRNLLGGHDGQWFLGEDLVENSFEPHVDNHLEKSPKKGKHKQGSHNPNGKKGGTATKKDDKKKGKDEKKETKYLVVDPTLDADGDGITDASRVGVAGMDVPPPPPIGRMKNLTKEEETYEKIFIDAFEADPDGMAGVFLEEVRRVAKEKGKPLKFETDGAKMMTKLWQGEIGPERAARRARYNVPLHATANAIAKRAFVKGLDELKKGDEVLVTVGGVGAGKGFALKMVPEVQEMLTNTKVVWDSAGDQNATENPWIQKEASKRGLKVTYVHVDADPRNSWANPDFGVVKRAKNPEDGRMVDGHVFADSYAIGNKNHQKFYEKHKDNKDVKFVFLKSRVGSITQVDSIPASSLNLKSENLLKFAHETIDTVKPPAHIKDGATIGKRLWGFITGE